MKMKTQTMVLIAVWCFIALVAVVQFRILTGAWSRLREAEEKIDSVEYKLNRLEAERTEAE